MAFGLGNLQLMGPHARLAVRERLSAAPTGQSHRDLNQPILFHLLLLGGRWSSELGQEEV